MTSMDESSPPPNRQSAGSGWLRSAGLLTGLGFIGWLLWRLLSDPGFSLARFAWRGFAEAVLLGVLANAVIGSVFSALVAKVAPGIEAGRRLSAYYHAQVAKYVPGRIAALLVQRSVLAGPHASIATLASNIELTVISCWLCAGAGVTLLCIGGADHAAAVPAGLLAIGSGAWLIRLNWKPLLTRMLSLVARLRPIAASLPAGTSVGWWKAMGFSAGVFAMPAASSFVLLSDGMHVATVQAAHLTALLLLSWVVGALAFVFPAGIGVRELMFFALAGVVSQAPDAGLFAGAALASRLVQILSDIVGVLLFFGWRRWTMRRRAVE